MILFEHRSSPSTLVPINKVSYSCIECFHANSILIGSPINVLSVLQRDQNSFARVVLQADCSASSTTLLQQLHWLPIEERINFKLATLSYKVLVSGSPANLSSLLTPYHPVRTLRSSGQLLLQRFHIKSYFVPVPFVLLLILFETF